VKEEMREASSYEDLYLNFDKNILIILKLMRIKPEILCTLYYTNFSLVRTNLITYSIILKLLDYYIRLID
jgi:hypothetical protein